MYTLLYIWEIPVHSQTIQHLYHHYLGKRITPGLNLNTKNLKFRKSVFDYILKHVKGNQGIYLQDIRVFLKNLLVQFSFRDVQMHKT